MKCDFKDNGMIGSKVVIGQYNKLKKCNNKSKSESAGNINVHSKSGQQALH